MGWFRSGDSAGRGVFAGTLAVLASLVILCTAVSASAGDALRASAYKVSGTQNQTQVQIHFDRDPAANWFLLSAPYRLVIDLPKTEFIFDPASLKSDGIVSGVRYGEMDQGRSRIILTAKRPFTLEKLDIKPALQKGGFELALDLEEATHQAFAAALADQAQTTGSTVATPEATAASAQADKFTVVIDPGHGGIDGGAKSPAGTVEKEITLAFGLELKKKLEDTGRYTVLLTRDSDVFLPLNDRVEFARQHDAKLFISIHADTIRVKGLRGATVYTVSDEASDAESAALADRENLADAMGGIKIEEENQDVADILVDLIRRETHGFSVSFARTLLDQLAQSVKLINNPHRHARFRVLRAPDIPSVLVELGYLSNAEDEEQLRSADWRAKTAVSIVEAVESFAASALRAGG